MKPYILMIDDNVGDLQLIESAFADSRIPIHFIGVSDVAAAIGHLDLALRTKTAIPDVMIVDLGLSSMSGTTVVSSLRTNPASASIPLVVFSGSEAPDIAKACLAAGATRFFRKPASYREYLLFVRTCANYWSAPFRKQRSVRAASAS